ETPISRSGSTGLGSSPRKIGCWSPLIRIKPARRHIRSDREVHPCAQVGDTLICTIGACFFTTRCDAFLQPAHDQSRGRPPSYPLVRTEPGNRGPSTQLLSYFVLEAAHCAAAWPTSGRLTFSLASCQRATMPALQTLIWRGPRPLVLGA